MKPFSLFALKLVQVQGGPESRLCFAFRYR